MKAWFQRFMYGRYGHDDLNNFLIIFALIISAISLLTRWIWLNPLSLILLFISIFRMLSRNSSARAQENYGYLRVKNKIIQFFRQIKSQFSQRKTHRFFRCPSCKQQLRVPKGKGLINIRCPKCQTSFTKKT